jgi:hypothetical protein
MWKSLSYHEGHEEHEGVYINFVESLVFFVV